MELVVQKELLKVYLESLTPKKKEEKLHNLILSLESPNNKMKISDTYLDILESYFSNECNTLKDFFRQFITALSDENRIITFKTKIESNIEEELLIEMMGFEHKDFTFLLTKNIRIEQFKSHQTNFDSIAKPNLDWFILSLSSNSVVQLDYSDFKNTAELEQIFLTCSNFPQKGKELHIIDSYFNLNGNSQLKSFKSCGHKIKCYTSSFNKSDVEKTFIRQSIKSYFGNKTAIRFSNDKSLIHERKILTENLIIDSTHDFSELTLKNKNWTVYFLICDIRKEKVIEKLTKYN